MHRPNLGLALLESKMERQILALQSPRYAIPWMAQSLLRNQPLEEMGAGKSLSYDRVLSLFLA